MKLTCKETCEQGLPGGSIPKEIHDPPALRFIKGQTYDFGEPVNGYYSTNFDGIPRRIPESVVLKLAKLGYMAAA